MEKCGRCQNVYNAFPMIRKCPHPAVNKKYGEYICYFCCKRCKHNDKNVLGVRCIYPKTN